MLPKEMLFSFKFTKNSNGTQGGGDFFNIPQKFPNMETGDTAEFAINGDELRNSFSRINDYINRGFSFEIQNKLNKDEIDYIYKLSTELLSHLKLELPKKSVKKQNKITKREYAIRFNYSERQAERHLKNLSKYGYIKRYGAGPSTYYEVLKKQF